MLALLIGLMTLAGPPNTSAPEPPYWSAPVEIRMDDLGDRGLALGDTSSARRKSPSMALLLALGSTAGILLIGKSLVEQEHPNWEEVGGGLTAFALFIGPSVGNFYALDFKRGLSGILARGGGVVLVVIGALLFFSDTESPVMESVFIFGGYGVFFGSMIWNIVMSPVSAREYNERNGLTLSLAPRVDPVSQSVGLTFHLRF